MFDNKDTRNENVKIPMIYVVQNSQLSKTSVKIYSVLHLYTYSHCFDFMMYQYYFISYSFQ